MEREHKYLSLEQPDNKAVIDFLGTASRKRSDRRACTVTVTVENGQLSIEAKAYDDRATILFSEVVDIPEEDRRR